MKVKITEHAEDNLWRIYRYHAGYSVDYADEFQAAFDRFVFENLSAHPKLGTLYNPDKDIYRMVYNGRYNIYYVIRDAIYIVYVLGGRMQLNSDIAEPDFELPTIS